MNVDIKKVKTDEIEINVKNLIIQFVRKWKLTVVVMLIFAIVLPVVVYLLDSKEFNSAQAEALQPVKLSEAEQLAIDEYYLLEDRIAHLNDYAKKSILLSIDPYNVYKKTITYYITSSGDEQYDVASMIVNYVNNGGLVSDIYKQGGYPEEKYIQEIIWSLIMGSSYYIESGVVRVEIVGVSKEEVEKYANVTLQLVGEYCAKLQEDGCIFQVKTVDEVCVTEDRVTIYESKKANIDIIEAITTEQNELVATFNDAQRKLIAGIPEGEGNSLSEISKPTVNIGLAVVGAIGGMVLTFLVVIIMSLRNIQSDKEILKRLNIAHFGSLICDGEYKWINRLLYRKHTVDVEGQIKTVMSYLQLCMENKNVERVFFVSTLDQYNKKHMEQVITLAKENGIDCYYLGDITQNTAEICKTDKDAIVVFVETVGMSKVSAIYEEALVCMNAGVNVAGYISIHG